MTTQMRAVAMKNSLPVADASSLIDVELPVPEVGAQDLLVRVQAVSVNPVDVKVRSGAGEQAEPKVLGWDAVGVVEALGAEARGFSVGDRVMYAGSLTRPGTNSELHAVDARLVGRAPSSLSAPEAAALPLTALTAWEALFDRMGLDADSRGNLLVIGGAGGTGSIVVQLAKAFTGLRVISTASRESSRQWCRDMGADDVVDHHSGLAAQVQALGGADYVFSAYTEGREQEIAEAMNPQGHLVMIDDQEMFPIGAFKPKSITVTPELMFTRSLFQTADMARQGEIQGRVAGAVDAGRLRTTMTSRYQGLSAQTVRAAHAEVESGRAIGKVVIEL